MKRTLTLIALLILSLTLTASTPPVATYESIAVSREDRSLMLGFEDASHGRYTVHVTASDAERMRDDLNAFYPRKEK